MIRSKSAALVLLLAVSASCGKNRDQSLSSVDSFGSFAQSVRVDADPALCTMTENDWLAVLGPNGQNNAARRWDEMTLALVRRDIPMPGVHARNLYTLSLALYETWAHAAHAPSFIQLSLPTWEGGEPQALADAMDYAAYRVLAFRYSLAKEPKPLVACVNSLMIKLHHDGNRAFVASTDAAKFGQAVGDGVLTAMHTDGANERNRYVDTTGYVNANPVLEVSGNGAPMNSPSLWQPLKLREQYTQSGIFIPEQTQVYIGPHWGQVMPFAMPEPADGAIYLDVGRPPLAGTVDMNDWLKDFFVRNAELNAEGDVDTSPAVMGNSSLGANDGHGRALNPSTGLPYEGHMVRHSDFTQTLAEYWADGPHSETPPGHWNVLANQVADTPGFVLRLFGRGPEVSRLEWDVKTYLTLNGALHDSAVAAWAVKRKFLSARPISLIRYAGKWQSSDPDAPNYEAMGLPLQPGIVEQVTAASAVDVTRHFGFHVGEIVVRRFDGSGFSWTSAGFWTPFQAPTFVTPAFPGFVSGHSTYSRAAAKVLSALTGSEFFPGGLGREVIDLTQRPIGPRPDSSDGPHLLELQWATYYDAADQAGLSRVYGGIHLGCDDFAGRRLGDWVGEQALARVGAVFGPGH